MQKNFSIASLFSLILISGIILGFIEGLGIAQGVYLASISAFTVGFEDVTPHTATGKIFCAFILPILGMILTEIVVSIATKSIKGIFKEKHEEK